MIRVIPSIDIFNGQCVRLAQGDFSRLTVYGADPVSLAREYEETGFRQLHLVDLDGSRQGRVINIRVLEEIASRTGLILDFGGGIKTEEDLIKVFNAGARMVNLGTIAVNGREQVEEWLDTYGSEKFILSADVAGESVAYHAWQDRSDLRINEFIDSYIKKGINKITCTDIGRDGMLQGPSVELYASLRRAFTGVFLTASGGISRIDHIRSLDDTGVDAAIIGRALYENPGFIKEIARHYL